MTRNATPAGASDGDLAALVVEFQLAVVLRFASTSEQVIFLPPVMQ